MTIAEKLVAAWDAAQAMPRTDAGIAIAHAFVCHSDGSDCDGGATCSPDREALNMYNTAEEALEEGKSFETYALEWMKGAAS